MSWRGEEERLEVNVYSILHTFRPTENVLRLCKVYSIQVSMPVDVAVLIFKIVPISAHYYLHLPIRIQLMRMTAEITGYSRKISRGHET